MELQLIRDINDPMLDIFSKATEPQLRRSDIFVAETANVCLRAIEDGYEPLSILVDSGRIEAEAGPVLAAIDKYFGSDKSDGFPVYTADRDVLSDLTGYALVRGLWMTFKRNGEASAEEFLKDKRRIVVMMDIDKPENVGAIFRNAAALGMDGVLLDRKSVDPLTRRVSRVSMGTVFQIPWARASREKNEDASVVRLLQDNGFKTVAMALTDDSTGIDNEQIRKNDKVAVLLGNEGHGLSEEVIRSCDYRVMIPMYHGVDSLNVAAAGAIAFWELLK